MHDRFAARCKAAAAANLAYIIRYILPFFYIYTETPSHPYITEWIEQWSSKRLTSLSSCLPLSPYVLPCSIYSLSGKQIPLWSPSYSTKLIPRHAPANCSLRRYANCMEINYFRNWNWRFSDSSPKMFWSMSNFIVNALVRVVSVPQRRLKDGRALKESRRRQSQCWLSGITSPPWAISQS